MMLHDNRILAKWNLNLETCSTDKFKERK
jgi:hypothetical protein